MIWNCCHFKRWTTKFTRNQQIFQFLYLFKYIYIYIYIYKCHLLKQLYAFIIKICKNKCSKIDLYEKVIFGQKDMQSFFEVLAHFILFVPKTCSNPSLLTSMCEQYIFLMNFAFVWLKNMNLRCLLKFGT